MVVVYDDNERPRVVVQGFGPEHSFASAVKKYAGTVDFHDGNRPIRWKSRDALICLGHPQGLSYDTILKDIYVLQIGGQPVGSHPINTAMGTASTPSFDLYPSYGEELVLPDDLNDEWRDLVKKHLLPAFRARPLPRYGVPKSDLDEWDKDHFRFIPFLEDLDGHVFAMRYRPRIGPRQCLYLPPNVIDDLTPWLLAAFKAWAVEAPDVFPAEPDWVSDQTWMTPPELAAKVRLDDARAEAERVRAQLEQAIDDAEAELFTARENADAGERVLLTGTDSELVGAVASALERLGFAVRDMDAERREKREDLRVSLGEWTAIVEVKGYGNAGGKPGDLTKIERFAGLYGMETGEQPAAKWYVVNQHRLRPPDTRRPLMRNHADDVESFGESGGLVIDTRDLFLLDKAVAMNELPVEDAQQLLVNARKWLELPTGTGPASESLPR